MAIAAVLLHISSPCAAVAVISVRLTIAVPNILFGYRRLGVFNCSTLPVSTVGLSSSPASQLVKTGDIFEHSKVIRVDRGLGLLLEIATSPDPTPAFVGVSDVADKEVNIRRECRKHFTSKLLAAMEERDRNEADTLPSDLYSKENASISLPGRQSGNR